MPGLELLSNSVVQIVLSAAAAAIVAAILYVLANSQCKVVHTAPSSAKTFSAVPKTEKKVSAARTPKTSAIFANSKADQWASTATGVPQITIGVPKKATAQTETAKPRRAADTPAVKAAVAAAAVSPTSAKKDTKAASPKVSASPKTVAKEAVAATPPQPKTQKKAKDGFEVVQRKGKDSSKKDTAEKEKASSPVGEASVLDLIFASSKGGSGGRGGAQGSYRPRGGVASPVAQAAPARSATVVVPESAAGSTRGWTKIDADAPVSLSTDLAA